MGLDFVKSVEFFREPGDRFRFSKVCYRGHVPRILAERMSGQINDALDSGNYRSNEDARKLALEVLERHDADVSNVEFYYRVKGPSIN